MMNTVAMIGRLTKNIDLRTTGSGKSVGTFVLAVNRNFTNQAGEREADFIQCVIWGKSADTLAKYAARGSLLGIEGRLQSRSYEASDGGKRYVTEVVTERYQLLESKEVTEQRKNGHGISNRTDEMPLPDEPYYGK